MSTYMTTKAAAEAWGISMRRINLLCQTERIPGAYKEGRNWMIPREATKPVDQRVKNPVAQSIVNNKCKKTYPTYDQVVPPVLYAREGFVEYSTPKKPLGIGRSEYIDLVSHGYYVDKTLLIRDIIDTYTKLALFTRPRRFGKTLNMDMLRTFFEISKDDNAQYFRDKKIWACGERYRAEQGKYPVIWFTLKDVKSKTSEETIDLLGLLIRQEFKRHQELATSTKISDKYFYEKIVNGQGTKVDYMVSLRFLSKMLHEHYGVAPVILIDEYDTPILEGYTKDFYDDIITFIRNFFGGGFKDNPHVSYGFMTGILRVSKESVFSGLNNLKVFSILDNRFSQYFGFTAEEVRAMAKYYEAEDKYEEIRAFYDGYRFGDIEVFNPWSVMSYFDNEYKALNYWSNTSGNDIITQLLDNADAKTIEKLQLLMQGQSIWIVVDTGIVYADLKKNSDSIFSLLLMTGYLKAQCVELDYTGDFFCELAIPNKELRSIYSKEVLDRIEKDISDGLLIIIKRAVYHNDVKTLEEYLNKFLFESVSFYDTANESFYHGLVLGLCALLDSGYRVTSNREAGTGRYDIQMLPKRQGLPGIIMEIKAGKEPSEEALLSLAQEALAQIKQKKYQAELEAHNVSQILHYGVAFCGKEAKILVE